MKDLLAFLISFMLISSLWYVITNERYDRVDHLPSGSVILDITEQNFFLGSFIVYKTLPNDGRDITGDVAESEMMLIYDIALLKDDGTYYVVGDTINHYNVYGKIIYIRKEDER